MDLLLLSATLRNTHKPLTSCSPTRLRVGRYDSWVPQAAKVEAISVMVVLQREERSTVSHNKARPYSSFLPQEQSPTG